MIKLIDNWKQWYKLWSIRFTAMGTLLLGYISASPEVLTYAWNYLPTDLKRYIPQEYLMYIAIALFILAMFSRVVKQEKLDTTKEDKNVRISKDY